MTADNFAEARRWVTDYKTAAGGARDYIALQLAAAAPNLLAKVDELTAELEQTREQRDLNSDLLDGAARALGIDLTDPDVHYAFDIPTKVAEVVAALTASRENAANLANEVGALKAELERMRAQRDECLRLLQGSAPLSAISEVAP